MALRNHRTLKVKGKMGGPWPPTSRMGCFLPPASSFPRQTAPRGAKVGASNWVPELGTKNVTAFQNKR